MSEQTRPVSAPVPKVLNVDNANIHVYCMRYVGKGTCASADNRLNQLLVSSAYNRPTIKQGSPDPDVRCDRGGVAGAEERGRRSVK